MSSIFEHFRAPLFAFFGFGSAHRHDANASVLVNGQGKPPAPTVILYDNIAHAVLTQVPEGGQDLVVAAACLLHQHWDGQEFVRLGAEGRFNEVDPGWFFVSSHAGSMGR